MQDAGSVGQDGEALDMRFSSAGLTKYVHKMDLN
jgi:hypothetical protein